VLAAKNPSHLSLAAKAKKKPVRRASGTTGPRTGTDVSACGRLA